MDKSFKVLQLGKFYPIRGGVEKVMYDLMTGLSPRGIECDMLCAHDESGAGQTLEVGSGAQARVLACRTWVKLAGTMISPSLVLKLRKICNDYDLIHVHHPDPMASLALLLSRYKGRVVLHWHSDILKQKTLLKFYKPLQDWLIRRADIILGTTPVYIEQSPHLDGAKHKAAYLPIGVAPVQPDAAKVEEIKSRYPGKKIILSLGRLVSYKGFKYLVRAAKYLPDDYVVVIGGGGPLKGKLLDEIELLGMADKVKLIGRIPDDELEAYYGACELFCLPSVMKTEAFGIVQIEAMSCGKPVVATTIPGSGTAWVNKHGYSGLNVQPRNAEELARAICEITSIAETYQRFCHNARERYHEVFTQEKMIDKCISYYNDGEKQLN